MKGNRPRTPEEPAAAGAAAPQRTKRPGLLAGVLNGSFLTREQVLGNMPFLLFIAGLMLVYIGYGYWTERTVRALDRTSTELKEMRSEYITVRSQLEQAEQQSQVAADIRGLGLKESLEPPHKIAVDEDLIENPAQ